MQIIQPLYIHYSINDYIFIKQKQINIQYEKENILVVIDYQCFDSIIIVDAIIYLLIQQLLAMSTETADLVLFPASHWLILNSKSLICYCLYRNENICIIMGKLYFNELTFETNT